MPLRRTTRFLVAGGGVGSGSGSGSSSESLFKLPSPSSSEPSSDGSEDFSSASPARASVTEEDVVTCACDFGRLSSFRS